MALEFDFLSPTDKPALLAVSNPEILAIVREALTQMDYKVHTADSHENFMERFGQVQYQVVVMEDVFGGSTPEENVTFQTLQGMSMSLRRHATVILIGGGLQTMSAMQAFQMSVHAVVNRNDVGQIMPIMIQVVNDNTLFLNTFRDVQLRLAQGKR